MAPRWHQDANGHTQLKLRYGDRNIWWLWGHNETGGCLKRNTVAFSGRIKLFYVLFGCGDTGVCDCYHSPSRPLKI